MRLVHDIFLPKAVMSGTLPSPLLSGDIPADSDCYCKEAAGVHGACKVAFHITARNANSALRFGLDIRQVGGADQQLSWVCAALRYTAQRRLRVSLQEEPSLYQSSDM